ncbi:hypothetical protein ACLK1V_14730 [Escherichia coli]
MHDAHPGYVSSQWAREMNLPTQTVLHHHAHAGGVSGRASAGRWMAVMSLL